MIKIKLKTTELDEAAKWRSTGFKTKWTQEEFDAIGSKYDDDMLFVHFDDGVPTDGETGDILHRVIRDKSGNVIRKVPANLQPQATFNPKTPYSTPMGIYAYPWNYAKDRLISGGLPFAQDKQFLYIYAGKDRSQMLKLKDAEDQLCFQRSLKLAVEKLNKSEEQIKTALSAAGVLSSDINDIMDLMFNFEEDPEIAAGRKVSNKTILTNELASIYEAYGEYFAKNHSKIFGGDFTPEEVKGGIVDFFKAREEFFLTKQFQQPPTALDYREYTAKSADDTGSDGFSNYINLDAISDPFYKNISKKVAELYKLNQSGSRKINVNPRLPSRERFRSILDRDFNYPKRWFYFVNNICDRNQNRVTKHYQDLGIGILVDSEGEGIIHSAEPTQAIIFNPMFAKVVGVKTNPAPEKKPIERPQYLGPEKKSKDIISAVKKLIKGKEFQESSSGTKKSSAFVSIKTHVDEMISNGKENLIEDNLKKVFDIDIKEVKDGLRHVVFNTSHSELLLKKLDPEFIKKLAYYGISDFKENDYKLVLQDYEKIEFDDVIELDNIYEKYLWYFGDPKYISFAESSGKRLLNVITKILLDNDQEKISEIFNTNLKNRKFLMTAMIETPFFAVNEPSEIISTLSIIQKTYKGIFYYPISRTIFIDIEPKFISYTKDIFAKYLMSDLSAGGVSPGGNTYIEYVNKVLDMRKKKTKFYQILKESLGDSYQEILRDKLGVEDPLKESDSTQSVNEFKIFKFNADKKMFKMLR